MQPAAGASHLPGPVPSWTLISLAPAAHVLSIWRPSNLHFGLNIGELYKASPPPLYYFLDSSHKVF